MSTKEAFEEIGKEIARQRNESMDDHVESAAEKLADENLVAFGLVAIREGDDGFEGVSQRAIDPEIVIESDGDGEELVDDLHEELVYLFERGVAER